MVDMKKEELGLSKYREGLVVYHENRGAATSPHRHDELEVNLVVRGSAAYLLGDRRYDLGEGTLVWLFPEQNHVLVRQSQSFAAWWAAFGTGLLHRSCSTPETADLLDKNPAGHFCKRLDARGARRVGRLFADVDEVDSTKESGLHNAGLAYLLLSSWEAFRVSEDTIEGHDIHPAVEKVARILSDETDTADLTQLARRVGLSPSRLSRLFKEQVGLSITQFRNRSRLERFLELYGRGRRVGALEAALEAGFGSYAQFHRVFTQAMGVSLNEYRKEPN